MPIELSFRAQIPRQRTFAVGTVITNWKASNPGKDVIGFLWGDTPYGASSRIIEATQRAVADRATTGGSLHKYPPVAGEAKLLPLVIQDLARFGVTPLDPATQIMVTNGCMEGLELATLALVNPGDEVVVPGPYYHVVPPLVASASAKVVMPMGYVENGYKLIPAQLASVITGKTRAIHLTNPTNPVGECYSADELKALAEVLIQHENVAIIMDEIYERLVFEGTHTSLWSAAPELQDRMVILSSLSKNAGLSGLRIGWAGGSEQIILGMKTCKIQKNWGTNTLGQEALYAAMSDQEEFGREVDIVRERLKHCRDLASERLRKMGFDFVDAKAGMFLFPKVPDGLNLPIDTVALSLGEKFALALIPFGLSVAPGVDMGIEDRFRLAFSLQESDIRLGMDRLRIALDSLRRG